MHGHPTPAEGPISPREDSLDETFAGWRRLSDPVEVADALIDLYRRAGAERYDEAVTQVEHGLQCGSLALASGSSGATAAASFLHDIGHLLSPRSRRPDTDLRHEDIGARFLANWFGGEVTEPIRLHVAAKRFLCRVDADYEHALSPASRHSLTLQGGPMNADEAVLFEQGPHAAVATHLRRWDDAAKVPAAPTPSLDYFGELLIDVLRS